MKEFISVDQMKHTTSEDDIKTAELAIDFFNRKLSTQSKLETRYYLVAPFTITKHAESLVEEACRAVGWHDVECNNPASKFFELLFSLEKNCTTLSLSKIDNSDSGF